MKNTNTTIRTARTKGVVSSPGKPISDEIRKQWEQRDRSLDDDPDSAPMPPEMWARGVVGKHYHPEASMELYRPIKKQVTARIDADVIEWLKSEGDGGHLTRMNAVLRDAMNLAISAKGKKKGI